MGYSISQGSTQFRIKKENLDKALEALNTKLPFGRYHWATHVKQGSLQNSMSEWSWDPEFDPETGDINDITFNAEKLGDEIKMFQTIAPFVETGSYIQVSGEGGESWRWVFDGKTCEEVYPKW